MREWLCEVVMFLEGFSRVEERFKRRIIESI